MRKRILAIFLCLILTVSLAAAVAAEDFTVTLPPGSNYSSAESARAAVSRTHDGTRIHDDASDPDHQGRYSWAAIPRRSGRRLPSNATPSDPNVMAVSSRRHGLWEVQNCTVSVNGEGTFNCVMTIRIDKERFPSSNRQSRHLYCGNGR